MTRFFESQRFAYVRVKQLHLIRCVKLLLLLGKPPYHLCITGRRMTFCFTHPLTGGNGERTPLKTALISLDCLEGPRLSHSSQLHCRKVETAGRVQPRLVAKTYVDHNTNLTARVTRAGKWGWVGSANFLCSEESPQREKVTNHDH